MKVVIAVHGTRGDVEPAAAIARELLRRGHEIRMAVPPNLGPLLASAGLPPALDWGPDSTARVLSWDAGSVAKWTAQKDAPAADMEVPTKSGRGGRWAPLNPLRLLRFFRAYLVDGWSDMGSELVELATDADVIVTGMAYQEVAFTVAESLAIPLVTMHWCPVRSNSYTLPVRLPRPIREAVFSVSEWVFWRVLKPAEDAQRSRLGLATATTRTARRIVERGTLELQVYDEAFFPQLDSEWQHQRPFVGRLSLDLGTSDEQEVLSWIDSGTPPVYFGFGSTPVDSPDRMLEMIRSVCADLGVRALVNRSGWDLTLVPEDDPSMKIVNTANYRVVFPRCRAVVHHGGAGTVAEGVRAGVPTVAVWSTADQPLWASRIKALGIGASLKLSRLNRDSLTSAVRDVLQPGYAERTRAIAAEMVSPGAGVKIAADLIEKAAVSTPSLGATPR